MALSSIASGSKGGASNSRHSAAWKRAERPRVRRAAVGCGTFRPRSAAIAAAATMPCARAAWAPPKRAPSPMAKTSPMLVRPSASVSVSIEPLPRGTKRWAQPSARASSDEEAKP